MTAIIEQGHIILSSILKCDVNKINNLIHGSVLLGIHFEMI